MTDWTKKDFDKLHEAITNKLKSEHAITKQTVTLLEIKNGVATSMLRTERELSQARSKLCKVCRARSMYPCDVETGWSFTCEFIKFNST